MQTRHSASFMYETVLKMNLMKRTIGFFARLDCVPEAWSELGLRAWRALARGLFGGVLAIVLDESVETTGDCRSALVGRTRKENEFVSCETRVPRRGRLYTRARGDGETMQKAKK